MDGIRNVMALVRGQLWLIPSLILLSAAGLAWGLLKYGSAISPDDATGLWWLYSGEASTARDLLSSLLGGLITMTSLVVSITFVILTLAANQLGPRLISIFMRDLQIQSVLGLFIGTILYLVLIMRVLDDTLGPDGVPHLAITTGTVLSILCLLALVFYLHKIANLIIADNVVTSVGRELRETFMAILPETAADDPANDGPLETGPSRRAWPLALGRAGYIQVISYDDLAKLACEADLVIEVTVRAGHHVLTTGDHVIVRATVQPSDELQSSIRDAFTVGTSRTPAQDPEHGIKQLVEIALRALSPGINDPFTAYAVIDQLGASLEGAFQRAEQPRLFRDERGTVRVKANRSNLEGMLEAAFDPIRRAGKTHPGILIHLADAYGKLARASTSADHQTALLGQLEGLADSAKMSPMTQGDSATVLARIDMARQVIEKARFPGLP